MKQITWKWVGGKDGHYEIYVDDEFVQTCDECELNSEVRKLEENT